jgi:hypothetical protein
MLSLRNTRASVARCSEQPPGERSHTLIRIQVLFRCILAHGRSSCPRACRRGPGRGMSMCARATGARLAAHLNLAGVYPSQTSPPSIAIAAPVLGGPESVRVVLNSTSSTACVIAGCVGHTSVHSLRLCHTCSDRGPRAWGSRGCALCVSQLQHPNLHGPRDVLVLHCTGRCSRNRSPESKLPGKTRKHRRRDCRHCDAPFSGRRNVAPARR